MELAADLVGVTSLRTRRKRLLTGLVDLGMDAAAVWIPLDGGLGLREQVGLPSDIV